MDEHADNRHMTRFLLELRPFRDGHVDIQDVSARSRAACAEMSAESLPVRFLRSVLVPEQDTCFLLFEADSAPTVAEAARRARVPQAVVWELYPA